MKSNLKNSVLDISSQKSGSNRGGFGMISRRHSNLNPFRNGKEFNDQIERMTNESNLYSNGTQIEKIDDGDNNSIDAVSQFVGEIREINDESYEGASQM